MATKSEQEDSLLSPSNTEFADKYDNTKEEAMDFLNIDDEELDEVTEITPKFDEKQADAVLKVKSHAESFEMLLKGKDLVQTQNGEKWVQKKRSLAGESFISLAGGILGSFSNQSNLLSNKDEQQFLIQFEDAYYKVSSMALRDRSISETNLRGVMKIFKDRMWLVGNIICNTKGNMDSVFNRINRDYDENFGKNKPWEDKPNVP